MKVESAIGWQLHLSKQSGNIASQGFSTSSVPERMDTSGDTRQNKDRIIMHFVTLAILIGMLTACSNNNTERKEIDKKIEAPKPATDPKPVIVPVETQEQAVGNQMIEPPKPATDSQPTVVSLTEELVNQEKERLNNARKKQGPEVMDKLANDLVVRALSRYGKEPFSFVFAGTDSVSGGIDGWRSCAKFGLKQLGLQTDLIAAFLDQDKVSCDKNPDGYVAMIVIIGPEGIEKKIQTPTYKTEKMTVLISGATTITGR